MSRLSLFAKGLLACLFAISATAQAQSPPATLRYANRDIATFRADMAGAAPAERVALATRALDRLGDAGRREPVTLHPFVFDGRPANAVLVGNQVVFSVLQADAGPESFPIVSARVRERLQASLEVMRAQRQPRVLARGIALSIAGALAAALLLLLVLRTTSWMTAKLPMVLQRILRRRARWQEYVAPFLVRVIRLVRWVTCLVVVIAWVVSCWRRSR